VATAIAEWYDELASSPAASRMADAIRGVYDARDLRALRMAYNDLVEIPRAASAAQRRELDHRLRTQANTSLEALDGRMADRIRRIRARGRVTSEEQYYLVREHVEFIATLPERANEACELLALLDAYEQHSKRPGAD